MAGIPGHTLSSKTKGTLDNTQKSRRTDRLPKPNIYLGYLGGSLSGALFDDAINLSGSSIEEFL